MTSTIQRLKRWLKLFECTPLHPQWLVSRNRGKTARWLKLHARGLLVDIGCGNGRLRELLPDTVRYIGIDYPTTMALGYSGKPDILADAARLPIASSSVDTVVMLDVLEHLAEPGLAVSEAARILRPGGQCLIHVPFLYPLHDEPYDYQRWTRHGLQHLLERHGLQTQEITKSTTPMETAATLLCIALAKGLLDAMKQRSPMILLAPLILALLPIINMAGWLLGTLFPASSLMPCSYCLVASVCDGKQLSVHAGLTK
jgi:SAM-dependent methyltransferase